MGSDFLVLRSELFADSIVVFFFKQKTAYEMRISDWSSDVCSSDLLLVHVAEEGLEHEQGPDRGAVVADAARVLVQQALDERHIEKIDLFQQAREKPPPDRLPQRAAEPVRQRAGESHLLAVENLARQPRSEEQTSELQSLMRISYADFG